jgi:carboxyl-terminal processing protease
MKIFWKLFYINSITFFGLVLLLTMACSPIQIRNTSKTAHFKSFQATEVFAAGYASISEKYIEKISIEDIAIEGLRGLGSIDPDLTIVISRAKKINHPIDLNNEKNYSMIVLSVQGREIIRKLIPPPDDIYNWATLTTEISIAAMETSYELRSASIESIYEAIFDGALSNLDIYSRYSGAKEAHRNRNKRDGFGGIGISFKKIDGIPVITSVLPSTPAEIGGVKIGDHLTHINKNKLKGLKRREISALLHGPIGTRIELKFTRPNIKEPKELTLQRTLIFPVSLTQTISNGIVLVTLKSFNQNTTNSLSKKLEKARNLLGGNMKGLILDLRGNPGGLLKQSVKVVDLLLTKGMIISTQGRHADSLHQYEAGGRDLVLGLPVTVLLDGNSASAAEIVAAALQDRNRAVIIGTASFGKGSVQTILRLPNNGEITLTWSRLVTPSGYMFHGLGIRPEICTSGLTDNSKEIIRQVIDNHREIVKTLASWRKVTQRNELQRTQLRKTCPSESRHEDLELNIAKHLITNPELYARALNLSNNINELKY